METSPEVKIIRIADVVITPAENSGPGKRETGKNRNPPCVRSFRPNIIQRWVKVNPFVLMAQF
jgi:hypothetical protein